MILVFNKHVQLSKLADELLRSGLISPVRDDGTSAIQCIGTEVIIYVQDDVPQSVIEQITNIVNAHDPTPSPKPPTTEERLEALELAVLEMILGGVADGSVSGGAGETGKNHA